jgi:hypothetical protein
MHLCPLSNNAFQKLRGFSPSNLGAGNWTDPRPDLAIVLIVSAQQAQTELD